MTNLWPIKNDKFWFLPVLDAVASARAASSARTDVLPSPVVLPVAEFVFELADARVILSPFAAISALVWGKHKNKIFKQLQRDHHLLLMNSYSSESSELALFTLEHQSSYECNQNACIVKLWRVLSWSYDYTNLHHISGSIWLAQHSTVSFI